LRSLWFLKLENFAPLVTTAPPTYAGNGLSAAVDSVVTSQTVVNPFSPVSEAAAYPAVTVPVNPVSRNVLASLGSNNGPSSALDRDDPVAGTAATNTVVHALGKSNVNALGEMYAASSNLGPTTLGTSATKTVDLGTDATGNLVIAVAVSDANATGSCVADTVTTKASISPLRAMNTTDSKAHSVVATDTFGFQAIASTTPQDSKEPPTEAQLAEESLLHKSHDDMINELAARILSKSGTSDSINITPMVATTGPAATNVHTLLDVAPSIVAPAVTIPAAGSGSLTVPSNTSGTDLLSKDTTATTAATFASFVVSFGSSSFTYSFNANESAFTDVKFAGLKAMLLSRRESFDKLLAQASDIDELLLLLVQQEGLSLDVLAGPEENTSYSAPSAFSFDPNESIDNNAMNAWLVDSVSSLNTKREKLRFFAKKIGMANAILTKQQQGRS
jgi:hypothetical protein